MNPTDAYEGTKRFAQARWPTYLIGYGGGTLAALFAIGLGLQKGWLALIPFSLAAIMVLSYLALTSLWAAHRLYDNQDIRNILFELGRFRPEDSLIFLDLGLKWLPAQMARRLTTGHIIVIDLYNPNLTPDSSLARAQQQARHPDPDPRLSWRDGDISLLPLPDGSVPAVILAEVACEFWNQGDRQMLISEIYRILAPGGRLIMAERVRTTSNLLMMGLDGFSLEPAGYWRNLIGQRGFRINKEENLAELMHFMRAIKPLPDEGQQLIFDFGY